MLNRIATDHLQSLIGGVISFHQDVFNTDKAPYNKQLLDEVERDIMNYQNRGLCYLRKPKAEADNTDTRF